MFNILDKNTFPLLEDIKIYINNSIFNNFYQTMEDKYATKIKLEYSSCSWAKGWNLKFKKYGKNICTLYPHENYFTVLIIVSEKEKLIIEEKMKSYHSYIQKVYNETQEGNGQRWLMIDIINEEIFNDVLELIDIRFHQSIKKR